MTSQENAANRETEQRMDGGSKRLWLRRGAFVALIGAVATVITSAAMIGGSAPVNACLLGIPCW